MNPLILAAIGYFLWQNQKKKAATTAAAATTATDTTPVAVGGSGGNDINDQYAWMYDSDRSAN